MFIISYKVSNFDKKTDKILRYLETNWKNCYSTFKKIRKNADWLTYPFSDVDLPGPGAKEKPFMQCGPKAKKYKSKEITDYLSIQSPNRSIAGAKQFLELSSSNCLAFENTPSKVTLSVSDSFDVFIGGKFSVREYGNISKILKAKGIHLKSYKTINNRIIKNIKNDIVVNVDVDQAKIDPELAFNWMLTKILEMIDFRPENFDKLEFTCKFGFDGAETQQEIDFQKSDDIDDKYFFIISFVPLKITYENNKIWVNENPNSTDWCKPIEIVWRKENDTMTNEKFNYYQRYKNFKSLQYKFNIILIFSMMDQKAINACNLKKPTTKGVDSCCCYICKFRSIGKRNFQNFDPCVEPENERELYEFGLSPLHGLLNFTKFIIYNVATTINQTEKNLINERLTQSFNIDFGEIKRGFGSKITGNVARMLFRNIEKFSNTIKVDIIFLKNVEIMLEMVRSKQLINYETFHNIIEQIANFLKTRGIHLTPTVHKYLHHSYSIVKHIQDKYQISPGSLSEEPMEAIIRKARQIRKENSRMVSRKENNYDTFIGLYIF